MTPLESKLQVLLNAVREADPTFAEELERNYSKGSEVGEGQGQGE